MIGEEIIGLTIGRTDGGDAQKHEGPGRPIETVGHLELGTLEEGSRVGI